MIPLNLRRKLFLSFLISTLAAALIWSVVSAAASTLTAEGGTTSQGQAMSVPVTLDSAPNGLSGFSITVRSSNGGVASITDVSLPNYGLTSFNVVSSTEAHIMAVDLNGLVEAGAANVNIATVAFLTGSRGSSDITIEVTALDDDEGFPVDVQTVASSISVTKKGRGGGDSGGGGKGGGGNGGKGGGKGRNK